MKLDKQIIQNEIAEVKAEMEQLVLNFDDETATFVSEHQDTFETIKKSSKIMENGVWTNYQDKEAYHKAFHDGQAAEGIVKDFAYSILVTGDYKRERKIREYLSNVITLGRLEAQLQLACANETKEVKIIEKKVADSGRITYREVIKNYVTYPGHTEGEYYTSYKLIAAKKVAELVKNNEAAVFDYDTKEKNFKIENGYKFFMFSNAKTNKEGVHAVHMTAHHDWDDVKENLESVKDYPRNLGGRVEDTDGNIIATFDENGNYTLTGEQSTIAEDKKSTSDAVVDNPATTPKLITDKIACTFAYAPKLGTSRVSNAIRSFINEAECAGFHGLANKIRFKMIELSWSNNFDSFFVEDYLKLLALK